MFLFVLLKRGELWVFDFYQTQPISDSQKERAANSSHSNMQAAQAGESPFQVSGNGLSGPKPKPPQDEIERKPSRPAPAPQVEQRPIEGGNQDAKQQRRERHGGRRPLG